MQVGGLCKLIAEILDLLASSKIGDFKWGVIYGVSAPFAAKPLNRKGAETSESARPFSAASGPPESFDVRAQALTEPLKPFSKLGVLRPYPQVFHCENPRDGPDTRYALRNVIAILSNR